MYTGKWIWSSQVELEARSLSPSRVSNASVVALNVNYFCAALYIYCNIYCCVAIIVSAIKIQANYRFYICEGMYIILHL